MIRLGRIRCRPSLRRWMTPAVLRCKRRQEVDNARRGFVTALIEGNRRLQDECLARKRPRARVAHVRFDMRLHARCRAHLGGSYTNTGIRRAPRNSACRKRTVTRNKDVAGLKIIFTRNFYVECARVSRLFHLSSECESTLARGRPALLEIPLRIPYSFSIMLIRHRYLLIIVPLLPMIIKCIFRY